MVQGYEVRYASGTSGNHLRYSGLVEESGVYVGTNLLKDMVVAMS